MFHFKASNGKWEMGKQENGALDNKYEFNYTKHAVHGLLSDFAAKKPEEFVRV
jgi:hypothetical protein